MIFQNLDLPRDYELTNTYTTLDVPGTPEPEDEAKELTFPDVPTRM